MLQSHISQWDILTNQQNTLQSIESNSLNICLYLQISFFIGEAWNNWNMLTKALFSFKDFKKIVKFDTL